jgi:hypothetical protein
MTDKLDKFHLTRRANGQWALEPEGGGRAKALFQRKADATRGGALRAALGSNGGSVRIHKTDGKIQEERTYPRSKDPTGSEG